MTKGNFSQDGIVPLRGVVRDGVLASILDQNGNELGAPVTAVKTLTGRIKNVTVNGRPTRRLFRSGNVGTRILGGRAGAFDNTTQKTFRAIIETAAGFDAVRPIFANFAAGATYTVAGCNVRALANLTDALPTAKAATLPSSGIVPVAISASRRSYLLGDWIDLTSIDRTDGGKGALVCIDAYVSTAASLSIMGNGGSDNFANWATRPNRKWLMYYNDGDCVTTPGNFVSTTARIQSPILGVQYAARGLVITVIGSGDSITDGRSTYIGEGFGVPACEVLSEDSGTVFEWANLGWAGMDMPSFRKYIGDAVSAGIVPDIAVFPCGSPNSMGTPITAAAIASNRSGFSELLRVCRDNQILPVTWTVMPTNSSVKDYNASDSLRIAYNESVKKYPEIDVLDFSTALSGATDADGQVNMLASATTDGIHPNDVGNAILSAILADYLKTVF